jgi:hypothetical protein
MTLPGHKKHLASLSSGHSHARNDDDRQNATLRSTQVFFSGINGIRQLHVSIDAEHTDSSTRHTARTWLGIRDAFTESLIRRYPACTDLQGISSSAFASSLVIASCGTQPEHLDLVKRFAIDRVLRKNPVETITPELQALLLDAWPDIIGLRSELFDHFRPSFVDWKKRYKEIAQSVGPQGVHHEP